ncbi:MAG: LysR family transcriptional regulator [Oscillospiraceae bacterium]|nr:LysR family transcriptional regulator [Oscillospiraceae bacterium]
MISNLVIKTFLTLAETRNFTRAAARLFLTQQAVSKQIARLEEDLECQLIDRSRGGIRLTRAGELYVKVFSDYMEQLEQTRKMVATNRPVGVQEIHIGYLDLLDLSRIFGTALRAFAADHPEVRVEFHSLENDTMLAQLIEGKLGAAITFRNEVEADSRLDAVTLYRTREVLFVSRSHPLATPEAKYTDFIHEPVFFSLPTSHNIHVLLQRLDQLGFPYDNLIITDNMASSCTAIEMGQGVSFALDCCKLLDPKVFAAYATDNEVELVICRRRGEEDPLIQDWMRSFNGDNGETDRGCIKTT